MQNDIAIPSFPFHSLSGTCFKKKCPSFTVCIPRGMGVCMGTVGNTELLYLQLFRMMS